MTSRLVFCPAWVVLLVSPGRRSTAIIRDRTHARVPIIIRVPKLALLEFSFQGHSTLSRQVGPPEACQSCISTRIAGPRLEISSERPLSYPVIENNFF
jgi:hypothetical protein